MSKPSSKLFNVFVVFERDKEKRYPPHYPVRNYGTRKRPDYDCASLVNNGYHNLSAFTSEQLETVISQLFQKHNNIYKIVVNLDVDSIVVYPDTN